MHTLRNLLSFFAQVTHHNLMLLLERFKALLLGEQLISGYGQLSRLNLMYPPGIHGILLAPHECRVEVPLGHANGLQGRIHGITH